jgi:AraC-like DNA-binding protein
VVEYNELLPDLRLQPYLFCYWQLHTVMPLQEPFMYRVVADGCIDVFFDLHTPVENFVMGFCKNYTAFHLENSFHYLGVRFLPSMFPLFFQVNAADLSNRFAPLNEVIPATARFIAQNFHPGLSWEDCKQLFDAYFLRHLEAQSFGVDTRLYEAIEIILAKAGVLHIEKDLNIGLSPRQLRRLFEFYIGDSAKTFSQVVQFQQILRAQASPQHVKTDKIYYDHGYYDQAHFIKAFKNFYGVTPNQVFGP